MLYTTSKTQTHPFITFVLSMFEEEKIYLLPLRIFIGIGWFRAGIEKWLEPTWHNGTKLSAFLTSHVTEGLVAFPFYESLVLNVFEPSSLSLSYIIMIGQLLVGIAIITGTLTNLALLSGIFMNLNFILIGEIEPSAFYIIIQLVLLLSHIGNIGIDNLLAKKVKFCFFVAKPSNKQYSLFEKSVMSTTIVLLLITALFLIPQIEAFDPSSVHDPVMILFVLSLFAAAFFSLSLVQAFINPTQKSNS